MEGCVTSVRDHAKCGRTAMLRGVARSASALARRGVGEGRLASFAGRRALDGARRRRGDGAALNAQNVPKCLFFGGLTWDMSREVVVGSCGLGVWSSAVRPRGGCVEGVKIVDYGFVSDSQHRW